MDVRNLPDPRKALDLSFRDDRPDILTYGDLTVARFSAPLPPSVQRDVITLVARAMDHGYRTATADMRGILNNGAL